ncbi:MAG: ABC transporter permease subunit [Acidimicrobiia bacterium]
MTTIEFSAASSGHYGFRHVVRMEWIKLMSLRSTWWTLGVTVAAAVGIAAVVGVSTRDASGDLTNNALSGIAVGLLLMGVLGVLAMTGDYTWGTLRTSLAASPDRSLLLAAKAAVFGSVALVAGEVASLIAFFVGTATLRESIAAPTLGQPEVLRAVLLSGAGYCLIGLLGLGIGTIVRHTPAAIALLVGAVYVVAQLVGGLANSVMGWVPVSIVANSLAAVKPMDGMLSPWVGLGVLSLYVAVALGIGARMLVKRDA